jgi:hypothetical protein
MGGCPDRPRHQPGLSDEVWCVIVVTDSGHVAGSEHHDRQLHLWS